MIHGKPRFSRLFIKQRFRGCWLGLLLRQPFFYPLIHWNTAQEFTLDQDAPVQMPSDPIRFTDIDVLNQVSVPMLQFAFVEWNRLRRLALRLRLNGEEPDPELFTGIFRRLLTDPLEELMDLPKGKEDG